MRAIMRGIAVAVMLAGMLVVASPAQAQDSRSIAELALLAGTDHIEAVWAAPADAPPKYRLAWRPAGSGDKWSKATTARTTYRIDGLDAGVSYEVKVRGRYSGSDWGPWSPTRTAATGQAVRRIDQPVTKDAENDGSDRVARQSEDTAPEVEAAFVERAVLRLVFDDELDSDHVPDKAAFTVTKGASDTEVTVSTVAVSGELVTLTLGAAIMSSDTDVEVDYEAPSSDPLQNDDGDEVADFDDQPVSVASSLMSNLGQTNTNQQAANEDHVEFETGDEGGYLTSVTMNYRGQVFGVSSDQKWHIHTDSGCESSHRVVTLQTPTLSGTGNKVFTVPPGELVRLLNNTAYRLCHTNNSDASVATWGATTESDLDSGGQPGWEITDSEPSTSTYRLRLSGVAADLEPPSDNLDLASLTVNDGTDDVALVPPFGFDGDAFCTQCHIVSVGADVTQVTVTAEPDDDAAEVAILDADEDSLEDASTDPGFQVDVAVGATNLIVSVTAENGDEDFRARLTVYRGSRETVSNLDRPATASSATVRVWAVPFTAGADSALRSVTVDYRGRQGEFVATDLHPAIHEKHASEDRPGTHLADLEVYPDSLSVGDAEFPVAESEVVELTAGTTYYLVFSHDCTDCTSGGYRLGVTDADGERGLSGWSLGDVLLEQLGTSWTADSDGRTIAFAVNATTSYTEDPPDFADADLTHTRQIPENTPAARTLIGALPAATDPDGDTVAYTLEGPDADSFDFSADREVITKSPLDHETQEQHALLMTASDPDGNFDQADVTITVLDVAERGTVTVSPVGTPRVGTELTATFDDPDDGVTVTRWRWTRSDFRGGNGTEIEGADSRTYTPTEDDLGKWLWLEMFYDDTHDSQILAEWQAEAAVAEPEGPNTVDLGDITGGSGRGETRSLREVGDYIDFSFSIDEGWAVEFAVRGLGQGGLAEVRLRDENGATVEGYPARTNETTRYNIPTIFYTYFATEDKDMTLRVKSLRLPDDTTTLTGDGPETFHVTYSAVATGTDEPHGFSGDYLDTVDTQAWLDVTPTSRVVRGSVSWRFEYNCAASTCTSRDEDWYRLDLEEDEAYVFRAYGIEWNELQGATSGGLPRVFTYGPPNPLEEVELDLFTNLGVRVNLAHTTSIVQVTRGRTRIIRDPRTETAEWWIPVRKQVQENVTRSELSFNTGSGDDGIYYLRVRSAGSDIGGYRLQYWGER